MNSAIEIYQRVIDRLTAAQSAKDVEMAAHLLCVPCHVKVPNSEMTFDTPEMVRIGFVRYSEIYAFDKLTRLNRVANTATYRAEDCIVGYHTTEGLREDGSEMKPFDTQMTLFRIDGRWMIGGMDSTAEPSAWAYLTSQDDTPPGPPGQTFVDFETPEKNVLLHVIEVISAAFLSADAEGWVRNVILPFTMRSRDGVVQTFETEEEMRADFERYISEFSALGVTDIVRQITDARTVEEGVIEGTCRTYILSGAVPVVPAWSSRMRIMRQGGMWRLGYLEHALGHLKTDTNQSVSAGTADPKQPKNG